MVTLALPYLMLELRYYCDSVGESPFEDWFRDLDAAAAAKKKVSVTCLLSARLQLP
jgi:hypothetical protein